MNDESSEAFKPKSSVNAAHVIAGFRYQLLHSVGALVSLGQDEALHLEVSEDFSVTGSHGETDYQVKNSQAASGFPSYSLRSDKVRDCIARFWDLSSEAATERRLVFMARGGAAVERDFAFPGGQAGLVYWQAAALDADTAPIREALSALFPDHALGKWIADGPSDAELRDRLLRRVSWQLRLMSAEDLTVQIKDQLRPLFRERGWPVSLANQATKLLFAKTFEVASKPEPSDRQLTRLDLQEVIEEIGATAWLRGQFAQPAVEAATTDDMLVSELGEDTPGSSRSETVDRLLAEVRGEPLIWLHGAHGVGKSTLARLMARRIGGTWLILDLWPVRHDETSAVAAWRDLLRSVTAQPISGIIIDDFIDEASRALKARLAALSRTLASRGARVIVTSHPRPSPAQLADAGSTDNASIQAPYFSESEIAELVALAPSPPAEMVTGWSTMVYVTTGGGHPVLVVAKLASLRGRGWPNAALMEDFATAPPSQAIRLTREEARRDLLASLRELDETRSLEASQLLRRAGAVYDRCDDALLLKLAAAEPALRNAGDAISVLKGAWLEILPRDDVRISPLIADIVSDVPDEDRKAWRRLAAVHWVEGLTLNERTLPLCFWNAFWGEHDGVLLKLCEAMQTMEPEKLQGAAPILAPLSFLTTDGPIYQRSAIVGLYLRSLQFAIADAVDKPEVAGRVARRFLKEIDEAGDAGKLLLAATGPRMLMSSSAEIGPALRLDYALHVRNAFPIAEKLSDGLVAEPRALLPPQFGPEQDLADFLFTTVVRHIRSSQDQLAAFEALDRLHPAERNRFIDAIAAIYDGVAVFVHSGWSQDQIEDRDLRAALDAYDKVDVIAKSWARLDLVAEVWCARSVILDEGLEERDSAIAVIDAAMVELGALPSLVRQKAKVLAHSGSNLEAAELLLTVENTVGSGSMFERGLALRDGGVSAAKAGRFADAIRLFDKARESFLGKPGNEPLATALLVEKALALWRDNRKAEALAAAADAFDAVEQFEPAGSRQAERSHQFVRAIAGLMWKEPQPSPFTFGQPSQLESSSAPLVGAVLKPLADNWRVLAAVEATIGGSREIDARSMAKQDGLLNLGIERIVASSRYAGAVRAGTDREALVAGAQLVATLKLSMTMSGEDEQRVAPEALNFTDVDQLVTGEGLGDVVPSLILDLVARRALEAPLDEGFVEELRGDVRMTFGSHENLELVLDAASQVHQVTVGSPRAVILAGGIGLPQTAVQAHPANRFHRDMMLVTHVIFSLAWEELELGVGKSIADGWTGVLRDQRFLLKNPSRAAAALEDSLSASPSIASAAALLLAVSDAVAHRFADGWFDPLRGNIGKVGQRLRYRST